MNMHLKVVIATKRSTLDVCECPEEAFKSDLLFFWCRFWKGEEEWASIFELFSRPSKIYWCQKIRCKTILCLTNINRALYDNGKIVTFKVFIAAFRFNKINSCHNFMYHCFLNYLFFFFIFAISWYSKSIKNVTIPGFLLLGRKSHWGRIPGPPNVKYS